MKVTNPLRPSELQQQTMMHNRKKDNSLRGAVVSVDTDLIMDIVVMYTSEALGDFSGRYKIIFPFIYLNQIKQY